MVCPPSASTYSPSMNSLFTDGSAEYARYGGKVAVGVNRTIWRALALALQRNMLRARRATWANMVVVLIELRVVQRSNKQTASSARSIALSRSLSVARQPACVVVGAFGAKAVEASKFKIKSNREKKKKGCERAATNVRTYALEHGVCAWRAVHRIRRYVVLVSSELRKTPRRRWIGPITRRKCARTHCNDRLAS